MATLDCTDEQLNGMAEELRDAFDADEIELDEWEKTFILDMCAKRTYTEAQGEKIEEVYSERLR